jgi:hypothetical protein
LRSKKVYHFANLTRVEKGDLDVYNGELECPWKFKIILFFQTKELTTLELFSRTKKERSIWIQSFCRVLDAQNGVSPVESGKYSEEYNALLVRGK